MLRIILASILCFQAVTISADMAEGMLSILGANGEVLRERRATGALNYDPNCDPKYKTITASHTMCLIDVGTEVILTQADKDAIVKTHNDYRSAVTPKATNMQKMVWDDEMAKIAAKWALQCPGGHDAYLARTAVSLQNISIGQNMGGGYDSFATCMNGWHKEVADYKFGTGSINGKAVGHYTQIVHHKSARIGCGQADCTGKPYPKYYVCNYARGQDTYSNPYTQGESCSACSGKCSNNQCDCGGKLCYNDGKLDLSTCTCTCPAIYTGDQCQTLTCNYVEKFWCANANTSNCEKYSNYPIDCHMRCGVCPYPCNGKKCENGGTLDIQSCSCTCKTPYSGPTCTEKSCINLDKFWCKQYKLEDCKKYSNFPSDCSIMCEVCPIPCNGKKCLNGGKLDDAVSCKCKCVAPYTGDTCDKAECDSDKSWCPCIDTAGCDIYSNYKTDCGFKCGICKAD
ncbi:cysteine-rich venom protein Mr30 [Patella vulgata]|uniref:cysteine-rich venom protein Mr30 n=1 Tax=Patella vulgata TaxID=6465 RepID=UPI0024A7D6C9|nr:cysteine-rich venom protein Mr30 [Patella vulgata]